MANVLGVLTLLTLVLAIAAHVALVRTLARVLPRGRIVLGSLLPPLALLDGFNGAARRQAWTALVAISIHGVSVLVARAVLG